MKDSESNDLSLCEMKLKRSLIISPDLDALLEHEERTRARVLSITSVMTTSGFSSRSVSPSQELPAGLPPPPRHARRVKTPRSTSSVTGNPLLLEDTKVQARGTSGKPLLTPIFVPPSSSSTSNPYINPAPTLAELLVNIPTKVSVTTDPFINPLSPSRPYDYEQFLELSSHPSDLRDKSSPTTFTSPCVSREYSRRRSGPSASGVPKLPHPSLSLYDSYAPIRNPGKRTFDDSDRKHSHARRPSTGSMNTFFSREPINTVENEPRIGVSSTIFPPSRTLSHSHSFYNDPVFSSTKQNRDSHVEMYPLSQTEFNLDSTSMDCLQLSPIQFSRLSLSSCSSSTSPNLSSSRSPKALSATPKLAFYRTSVKPGIPRQLSPALAESLSTLPPTTNFLDSEVRTDLVRKTRKLARVFGKTPRTNTTPTQEASLSVMSRYSSVLNDLDWPILRRRRSALQSESEPSLLNGIRRHSMPLSPDDMPFITNVSSSSQRYLSPSNNQAGHHAQIPVRSVNTRDGDDITAVMPEADRKTRSLTSSPAQSQLEMFEEEQVDEDRRRKRDRLAKLHRFLGSHVPVNLVLGTDDVEASLPPPPTSASSFSPDSQTNWIKRRKSSSAILTSSYWSDDLERVKEELDGREKLINVRRAVKMEKVFGVAPPQTLYHTRHCAPPLLTASKSAPPDSPTRSALPPQRNLNRSAYLKYKKNDRPSTADSSMQLLPKGQQISDDVANSRETRHSAIYNHYQHSLNSLHDILARDDKESLVELHQYLNAGEEGVLSSVAGRRVSNASSIKSARRRSLPAMTSLVSLDSEYSVATPETNVTTFQLRRRKAAKLTQFFGVDYRELINDILQSIEHGLENEHRSGTLRAEEVEDLLARLRNLEAKRQSFK